MMERSLFIVRVMIAALIGTADMTAAATSDRGLSWGKSGMSFDDYRRDAMECGISGAKADIADRQDTRDVVDGTRTQDKDIDLANARAAVGSSGVLDRDALNQMIRNYSNVYQRNIKGGVKGTQAFMENTVTACLRARGYVPFRLTKAQAKARDRLHTGTLERRRFLYDLASDPVILHAQAVDREQPTQR